MSLERKTVLGLVARWEAHKREGDTIVAKLLALTGLSENALTPEIDLERIPLTDKPKEDGLFFDSTSWEIFQEGSRRQTLLCLTPTQGRFLKALTTRAGKIVGYDKLLTACYPEEEYLSKIGQVQLKFENERLRPIASYVRRRLRRSFPGLAKKIRNKRGIGYFWDIQEKEEQGRLDGV